MPKRRDSEPRTPREWRACGNKVRHPERGQALAAGKRSIGRGQIDQLWVYRCRICRGWHLTRFDTGPKFAVHATMTKT